MIRPRPARTLIYCVVAACAVSIPEARAALLVHEPFDYGTTAGEDQNVDGKKDLMGLAGGLGWSGAWTEITATSTAAPTAPLDYVNNFDLAHPSGDPRFSSGGPGSLTIYGFTASGQPTQSIATLRREFAEPFQLAEGTTLWLSVLLRKDFELPDTSTGQARPTDAFEIGFAQPDEPGGGQGGGFFMGDVINSSSSESTTTFGIRSEMSPVGFSYLAGSGPSIGMVNFLVMKLSVESGSSRLEFFLNPSLDTLSPVPDLSMPLLQTVIGQQFTGLEMNTFSSRPIWSVDEIRVGQSYADVVPEPSSLLLTGLGVTMLGGARLRRSRASLN